MTKGRRTFLLASLLIALVSLKMTAAVEALPAQQTNLLRNASFEQPFVNGVADAWSPYHRLTEKADDDCLTAYHFQPKWNVETNGSFVADAVTSQYIGNNWDTWSAGVYQTVAVTPGTTYRFSYMARGRATSEGSPAPSESGISLGVRAGIDPNGGTNWADGDVVWSATGSPHDTWQTFTVEATATGDQLTVFTFADLGATGSNQCRQFLDTWYDAAQLVAAGQPPTAVPPTLPPATSAPAPTAPPVATQLPAATEEASADPTEETPPTVEGEAPAEEAPTEEAPTAEAPAIDNSLGSICANAFHDENANGTQEANEGYMAGVTFTVADTSQVLGQAVSNGTDSAPCIHNLADGSYQVAQTVPDRLEMTTAANTVVSASQGKTIGVLFGSRLRLDSSPPTTDVGDSGEAGDGTDQPEEPADGDSTGGFDIIAISGLGVILLGVALLGVLLFIILRR